MYIYNMYVCVRLIHLDTDDLASLVTVNPPDFRFNNQSHDVQAHLCHENYF